ncbi:unnamed protein product [Phaeothamnion confervicola]
MSLLDGVFGGTFETGGEECAPWDPLGLASSEKLLKKYQIGELKNGRVAMLAVLGVIVQYFVQLPDPVFSQGAKPLAAFSQVLAERPTALLQIFLGVGILDNLIWEDSESSEPGNYGFGIFPASDEEFADLRMKEIKNARLAMIAFMGMIAQELVNGKGPIENILG